MLDKRSSQRSLFDAEYHFQQASFHWQLSQVRDRLFRDEEFAALYCLDNGRPSVPPSLLATALLLQAHDKVSDAEALRRMLWPPQNPLSDWTSRGSQTPAKHQRRYRRNMLFQYPKQRNRSRYGIPLVDPV